MATDLTKMVEKMQAIGVDHIRTLDILFAMAAEIEVNREEIKKLKSQTEEDTLRSMATIHRKLVEEEGE